MNKKLVILGAGESGLGAAVLGQSLAYDLFVSDFGAISESTKEFFTNHNIDFEEKTHSYQRIREADLIVKSPGIPDNAPPVKEAELAGIPVISEIEFAARHCRAKIVAVTGSNGKTTTTLLIYHILKKAGFNVGLAGNVGHSFARLVAEAEYEYYVLELSSFQLDGIRDFRANYAILLNITPDHLDRYNYEMQAYIDSKFKIIQNSQKEDYIIYCADDPILVRELEKRSVTAQLIPFSVTQQIPYGAYKNTDKIIINMNNNNFDMDINGTSLTGDHNVYNSMAAGIVARLNEVRDDTLRMAMTDFKNAPHRLENYISVRGVKFVNDSKATNINSTWYALHSIDTNVVLILGGIDKGNDYSIIKDLVRSKVKAIVCIGTDNSKIKDAFVGITEIYESENMYDAVGIAHGLADDGDTVLLSPACASQDRFKNYEDRGDQYKAAVREL